jgi:hypothetical protein
MNQRPGSMPLPQDTPPSSTKYIFAKEQSNKYQTQMTDLPAQFLTESQPLNNTRLHGFLVLAAIKLLKGIVPNHGPLLLSPTSSVSNTGALEIFQKHQLCDL